MYTALINVHVKHQSGGLDDMEDGSSISETADLHTQQALEFTQRSEEKSQTG